ncbi:uncharacterized protein LOC114314768 [Camellia sinensis]|uniref:uncharacterized protein LOC114314768 n=1 Tax=Camellia sinensis TaxID=4442 RepID=UPI001035572F|nr:uncharacterized protein LOC114314768 [Camellia sinensis]
MAGSRQSGGSQTSQGQRQSYQSAQSGQASRTVQGASSAQAAQQTYGQRGDVGEPRSQGRVYANTAFEQATGSLVVRGTFLIFNTWAKVLIDTGASHSFIATSFTSLLGLKSRQLQASFIVESPVGGKVNLTRECQGCVIEVGGRRLPFNFVVLEMSSFDIILGMDWWFAYRATIDCYREWVTVCTANGDCFTFLEDRCDKSLPSSCYPRSRGQFNFLLATLWEDGNNVVRNEFPRVVCEYPDIFAEDLTELPPHREVEFTIDLLPGTTPISLSPYKFAPAELVVLKE